MKTDANKKSKEELEHEAKILRLKIFLRQIRYPDVTAGYMNRLEII